MAIRVTSQPQDALLHLEAIVRRAVAVEQPLSIRQQRLEGIIIN
jgi:hypothetical protein